MNTLQIRKVLTKRVKYFQGVYPLVFTIHTYKAILVINLDKHYMPGSHLVAVCFSDSGYVEYFESFGLPPLNLEIISYL